MGEETDGESEPHGRERSEIDSFLREAARSPAAAPPGLEPTGAELGRVGQRLGRYEILAVLGAGGMGVVYRAEDTALRRPVALKVLPADKIGDPERRSRFLREARAAAAVTHPNIATVYDAGEVGEHLFLAMELCEGRSLRARLSEAVAGGQPGLPWAEVVRVGLDVSRALARAHAARIVHRDIKPENLVLSAEGVVKVLDFGIAKLRPREEVPTEVADTASVIATEEGRVLGTPGYMPPEQARGRVVDARADVFSLGVTLFELASGRRPFQGRGLDAVIATDRDEAPRLGDVVPGAPVELEAVVARCLQKDPLDRYGGGAELLSALERAQREIGVDEAPAATSPALSRTGSRARATPVRRTRWLAAAALVLVGLAVTLVLLDRRRAAEVADAASSSSAAPPAPAPDPSAEESTPDPVRKKYDVPAVWHLPPDGGNAEARDAYVQAVSLIRRAQVYEAMAALEHAVTADPAMAAAHVRLCWWYFYRYDQKSARRSCEAAEKLRGAFDLQDAMLMDALDPLVRRTAADYAESVRRLAANPLHAADPEALFIKGYATMNSGSAEETRYYADTQRIDPGFLLVYGSRAFRQAYIEDFDGALATAAQCLARDSTSGMCLEVKGQLLVDLGQCGEAEQNARDTIASLPASPAGYLRLAGVLSTQGASPLALRETLRQAVEHFPEAGRPLFADVTAVWLAQLTGDFEAAVALATKLATQARSSSQLSDHALPAWFAVESQVESGRIDRAATIARDFIAQRDAWQPAMNAEDFAIAADATPRMLATLRLAGDIDDRALATQLASWVDGYDRRGLVPMFRPYLWLTGYSSIAETPEQARAALEALPAFKHLPKHQPMTLASFGVGRTYLLAGHLDDALPWLERATRSCNALQYPMEHTQAHYHLGLALEKKQENKRACDAYEVVIKRWGNASPRSVTAERAKERSRVLRCDG